MSTITVNYLRCRDTGQWLVWNHQTYMLAHDVHAVCMGCLVTVTRAGLDAFLNGLRSAPWFAPWPLELVPTEVLSPVIGERVPLWAQR